MVYERHFSWVHMSQMGHVVAFYSTFLAGYSLLIGECLKIGTKKKNEEEIWVSK